MSHTSRNPILVSGRKSNWKVITIIGVAIMTIICVVSYFFLGKDVSTTLRVILGLIYVLFLPGFVLCWAIFPDDSEIDSVERLGLSFGLSIPLTLAWVLALDHVFGVSLTALNIVLGMGALMAVFLAIGFVRFFVSRRKVSKK